jgi:hypothetical protein
MNADWNFWATEMGMRNEWRLEFVGTENWDEKIGYLLLLLFTLDEKWMEMEGVRTSLVHILPRLFG